MLLVLKHTIHASKNASCCCSAIIVAAVVAIATAAAGTAVVAVVVRGGPLKSAQRSRKIPKIATKPLSVTIMLHD